MLQYSRYIVLVMVTQLPVDTQFIAQQKVYYVRVQQIFILSFGSVPTSVNIATLVPWKLTGLSNICFCDLSHKSEMTHLSSEYETIFVIYLENIMSFVPWKYGPNVLPYCHQKYLIPVHSQQIVATYQHCVYHVYFKVTFNYENVTQLGRSQFVNFLAFIHQGIHTNE
jgi:hypothetical protein